MLCDSQNLQSEAKQNQDEISCYLAKGWYFLHTSRSHKLTTMIGPENGNPRVYWKDHEHEFPVLARLARDILSISASGAGVKRLFNCARDVCHYRRGNLKPETIRDLMLHLFSSKFELEQSQLDLVKEYLSPGDAATLEQA